MVFYAFAKYATQENVWRYLLAAPDADTIDEWWRAVSAPSKKDLGYERLSPDFYTYVKGYPYDAAPEFTSRIVFTLLHDRDSRILSLFPHQDRTDVRSGQTFFVRSKSKPDLFWWVGSTGTLTASTKHRSRFRFDIEDEDDGTVIVGKSPVSVFSIGEKQSVAINNSDERCTSVEPDGIYKNKFYYGELKGSFLSSQWGKYGELSQECDHPDHSFQISMVEKGHGEEWELVK
ncbi:hypothetical protein ABKA04_009968 [Annulohypoxylon sp. FPYF3050]